MKKYSYKLYFCIYFWHSTLFQEILLWSVSSSELTVKKKVAAYCLMQNQKKTQFRNTDHVNLDCLGWPITLWWSATQWNKLFRNLISNDVGFKRLLSSFCQKKTQTKNPKFSLSSVFNFNTKVPNPLYSPNNTYFISMFLQKFYFLLCERSHWNRLHSVGWIQAPPGRRKRGSAPGKFVIIQSRLTLQLQVRQF